MKQAILALFLAGSLASSAFAQGNVLVGRIVARTSGEPMAFAVVALPSLGIERFATDSGLFYFGNLPGGSLALRIRRLGFLPLDTIVTVGQSQDTVRIQLTRIAMQLSGITVSAHPPCLTPGATTNPQDTALHTVINQIRMNAEQYKFLVKQYPFYYISEIVRSSRSKISGETRIDSRNLQRVDARADARYRPGRVVARRGSLSFFQVPSLVDFADRAFLENHCFHLRGTEVVQDELMIRVDVVAAERIKDPDVNGTIYIEPGSFQVTRTVLRLSKISKDIKYLTDFEITTEFREIMPSIPVVSRVTNVQTLDPAARVDIDMAWENNRLAGFEFLKGKPGEDVKRKP